MASMKVTVGEPVRTYLTDSAVQSAVNLLIRNSSDKRVGLDEGAPYAEQAEYRGAWLAAREIYVEWHALLAEIWQRVWHGSEHWDNARLTELTSLEVKAEDWDLPTMHAAWHEEWFGRIFRTQAGKLVGLYVFADVNRVHLNFHGPEIKAVLDGWEPDDGDFDSVDVADWDPVGIDLEILERPASTALQWLKGQ